MTADTERWWVIHDDDLRAALAEVAQGTHPSVAYLELLANAEVDTST